MYNGVVTLQIDGMTNGVTNVVVQKFLDVDTNGILGAKDLLVQQFQLTAGRANQFTNGGTVVTVTNFMPGDMSSTPGQIVAPLNFQNGDFMQTIVGHYLYKLSSPSGQFNPVTNLFVVNNSQFPCAVTGAVEIVASTNVPNAVVFLFSTANGGLNVQAGAVANNSGFFTLRAPPGTYFLAGAASNLVTSLGQQSLVPLIANFTNNAPVFLTPSTTNIAGRVVDAATNSIKVPGVNGLVVSSNNFLSLFLSDTNGNFVAPAVSDMWEAPVDNFAAQFAGYLTPQVNPFFNVSNKLVTITNALPRGTAIFYGSVTDSSGNPLSGVYMIATDNANHQSLGLTDKGGNYLLNVLGETNQWNLQILAPNNPGLTITNHVFSPGYVQTNINAGQAIQQNFVVNLAPYTISGTVATTGGAPIGGVTMFATATNIGGVPYQAFTTTTLVNGTYSLNVSPGNWAVGINAASLISAGFTNVPADQTANITNTGATINFSVLVCSELAILTTNLPDATVGVPYDATLAATSCQNITNWLTVYGITLTSLFDRTNVAYTNGTPVYSTAGMQGYLLSPFSYGLQPGSLATFTSNCTAHVAVQGNAYFTDISATINVTAPIASNTTITINGRAFNTTSAPSQVSVGNYQVSVFRPGSPDIYNGASRPLNFQATYLMFLPGSGKTNVVASLGGIFNSQMPGSSMNLPSTFAYAGTNGAVVWLKSGTNWGQYLISAYGPQTTNLPPGLKLLISGSDTVELTGMPTATGTNNGLFNFTVEAIDAGGNIGVQTYSLLVHTNPVPPPAPVLAAFGTLSSNVFHMQVNGVQAGANYTLLMSTNLATTNWTSIFTTNAPDANPLIIPDVNATNPARFYRVQASP
jgi:hypothetical protein